jgi:prevent-host-death family protein
MCYTDRVATTISQRQLRNDNGEIMRRVEAGESFIVTRHGVPVGELTPLRRRRFVPRDEVLEAFRGAPRIDYERLRADLDAVVDQDPTPRA